MTDNPRAPRRPASAPASEAGDAPSRTGDQTPPSPAGEVRRTIVVPPEVSMVTLLGPHDELLRSCPAYAEIVASQTAQGDADAGAKA